MLTSETLVLTFTAAARVRHHKTNQNILSVTCVMACKSASVPRPAFLRRLYAQGARPALGNMVLPSTTPGHRKSLVTVDSPAARELAEARRGHKADQPQPEAAATPPSAPPAAPWMVRLPLLAFHILFFPDSVLSPLVSLNVMTTLQQEFFYLPFPRLQG